MKDIENHIENINNSNEFKSKIILNNDGTINIVLRNGSKRNANNETNEILKKYFINGRREVPTQKHIMIYLNICKIDGIKNKFDFDIVNKYDLKLNTVYESVNDCNCLKKGDKVEFLMIENEINELIVRVNKEIKVLNIKDNIQLKETNELIEKEEIIEQLLSSKIKRDTIYLIDCLFRFVGEKIDYEVIEKMRRDKDVNYKEKIVYTNVKDTILDMQKKGFQIYREKYINKYLK